MTGPRLAAAPLSEARGGPGAVRRAIARETRAAHEALHVHPLLAALTGPNPDHDHYLTALLGFRDIYAQVERRRRLLGLWPELSLGRQCSALVADCAAHWRPERPRDDQLADAASLLGGLYALHGASFGAAVIRKNLVRTLPGAPMAFYSLGSNPLGWATIIEVMDQYPVGSDGYVRLRHGALAVFRRINEIGSEAPSVQVGKRPVV